MSPPMTEYFDDSLLDDIFIRDLSVLQPEYEPDKIEERDAEMDEYVDHLAPVLKGWDADNIFLYGESGVGKTVATRKLLPELREKAAANGVDVDIVETNCSDCSSSYQAAIQVVNEIRDPTATLTTLDLGGEKLNNTGYPATMVYNTLFEELQAVDDYLILVLDEIDSIGTDGELLYQLTRAQSMGKLDAELCIIGISNDLYFKDNLESSVRDTLCESEVHFPGYDNEDLVSILDRRAEQAFYDDVLAGDVIPLCAALATQEYGSARRAIKLLRKAAQLAESAAREGQDIDRVIREYVRAAQREIEADTVSEGIKNLREQACYLLLTVAGLEKRGKTPAETPTVYETYEATVSEEGGVTPLSRKAAHDNLLTMVDLGILELTNNARNQRGVTNKYALGVEMELVVSALEEHAVYDEKFNDIRNDYT